MACPSCGAGVEGTVSCPSCEAEGCTECFTFFEAAGEESPEGYYCGGPDCVGACRECGSEAPVPALYAIEAAGGEFLVCVTCVEEKYFLCAECGQYGPKDGPVFHKDGTTLCEDCHAELYSDEEGGRMGKLLLRGGETGRPAPSEAPRGRRGGGRPPSRGSR